jgi:hypothetical protein
MKQFQNLFQVILSPVATSHESIRPVIEGVLVSAIGFTIGFAIGNALMSTIWVTSGLAIGFAIGFAIWGAVMGVALGLTVEDRNKVPYLVPYLSCVSAIWSAILGVIWSAILNTSGTIWGIIGGIGMAIIWIIMMGSISGSALRDGDKKKVPYSSVAGAIGFPIGFVTGLIIQGDIWLTLLGAITVAAIGISFSNIINIAASDISFRVRFMMGVTKITNIRQYRSGIIGVFGGLLALWTMLLSLGHPMEWPALLSFWPAYAWACTWFVLNVVLVEFFARAPPNIPIELAWAFLGITAFILGGILGGLLILTLLFVMPDLYSGGSLFRFIFAMSVSALNCAGCFFLAIKLYLPNSFLRDV